MVKKRQNCQNNQEIFANNGIFSKFRGWKSLRTLQ